MDIISVKEAILNNKSFIITSHLTPDGDAIGSLLGLTLALDNLGKEVFPILNDSVPKRYLFLPHAKSIVNENALSGKKDVIICLDSADSERLGFKNPLKNYADIIINIDHHKSHVLFGDLNYVDPSASSVGEMVYNLVKEINVKINYDIALCLYTAIITDTGSVKHSNTTPSALRALADFVELGVKPDRVSWEVFEKNSLNSILLIKDTLNTLKISDDGKIAWLTITREMLEKTNTLEEDTEGLIDYARSIEGVEIALLFKEREDNKIKISLRSNGWIDVSEIAKKMNGGGHAKAAGCMLDGNMKDVEKKVLSIIKEYMKEGQNGGNY
ncbi:DHH family phosphoesterase [Thermovenabulum gondwanense]|uniref:Bifunctional oligoribonuclease and PAP phosphatase NrnA n=1 Tax=Thermovenabulum gondwanense TaxID=520767 RepID=A0A161QAT3_9FIRM|nr:bifunctional oligoribonuclease/PAP phosphatase NrnA [Thermovenabulum gondwanense]KYO65764.1 Bifunctional oligoribonuclease and PAP phosphatase NrnA [Thermovenabulum gondwanense]